MAGFLSLFSVLPLFNTLGDGSGSYRLLFRSLGDYPEIRWPFLLPLFPSTLEDGDGLVLWMAS